ncbi:MAG: fibronectin type III domain-containing protein [Planctomycetes bacterium]|nr:fibronectin type III domain-containing protein [Planctomycetota bacterium]
MNHYRMPRWIWNVLSIVLLLGSTHADVGNVWVVSKTDTSITIDWNVTDSDHPECSPPFYQVCWKESGTLAIVCNQNSATMTTHPYTITGLDCGTEYKIKVHANTWRKNWRGKLVDKDMREVQTIKVETKPCYVITGHGSCYSTDAQQTSIDIEIDWSVPSDFAFARLGYKKHSKVLLDIKKKTGDRGTNIANYSPNSTRGIIQFAPVLGTNVVHVTGLEECTKYDFHAFGFSSSPQHDPGTYIGGETVKTLGDCGGGVFGLGAFLQRHSAESIHSYLAAIEAFYGPSFTSARSTSGVIVLPDRLLAIDHVAGASTMTVSTLESRRKTQMRRLAATVLPCAPSAATMRAADMGSNRFALVRGDASFAVLDVANPLAPAIVGTCTLPGPAVDVVVRGSVAFAACRNAGLAVISLANPASPALLSTIQAIGEVTDAEASGNSLFVASRDIGVLGFDISNPIAPNFTLLYSPGYVSNAEQLTTDGTRVFVANSAGLEVLDATTLAFLGRRVGVSGVKEVKYGGTMCWLLGTMQDGPSVYSGVHCVDVSSPANIVRRSTFDPAQSAPGGTVLGIGGMGQDGVEFVCLGAGGASALDPRHPDALQEIGRWAPGSSPLLAHLAALDPSFATALQVENEEGVNGIWMEDMWEVFFTIHRDTFDAWQSEPALAAAGLDLATFVQTHFPSEWTEYQQEIDPTGHIGFNIDLGSSNAPPSASYDGAIHRAGTWSSVGAPWNATLTDPEGRASIMVASSTNSVEGAFASPLLDGDDEKLYEDGQSIGGPGSSVTWTFSNLVPGSYRVTTYAWNPNDSGASVSIDVAGSAQGAVACGGTWLGQPIPGTSHVVHDVQLAGTTMTLTATTLSGTGFLDGFQLVRLPDTSTFTSFCAGDGSGTPCPCANNGLDGHGCANSSFASGALLDGTGIASVSADTVQLQASSMTGATCVFFQGTSDMAPVVVGDGLGCVTGSVIRLGTKSVVAGTSAFPQGGDPLVSVRGQIPPSGATRYYQCFYRNAAAGFCPPGTSNRTNGLVITWAP